MKKNKLFTLPIILCLSLSLIGCGKSDADAIAETAETFLQAATECNMETVSEYCLESALTNIGLDALASEYVENIIYTNMQIEKDSLSEESQKAVSDFCTYYSSNLIQNFSIGEVSETEGIGLVNVTVTTYSEDALSSLSSDAFKTGLSELMNKYQEENMRELISVNLNLGEEAMMNKLFDDLMPEIMDMMKQSYDSYTPEDVRVVLTVEKTEDKWMITKASLAE